MCPLAWTHLCGDGTSPASHYALAQKVLPEHANTTAPGGVDGERRWVGGKGMCACTLCIWATFPFSSNCTHQKLKLGGCRRCLHEWVNLYHVCHRKIKALVYSGARLSAPISISKLRRRRRGELSHRGRRDRGYNCTHVASPRWLVEAIKYGHLCERGSRRWARRCIFEDRGGEGWWWWWWGNIPVKYAGACVCACTNMHISKHKNWGLFYAHKSELYQVYTWQVSFNKQQLYGFMGITYEQLYYVY